jgi:hypothetical protein
LKEAAFTRKERQLGAATSRPDGPGAGCRSSTEQICRAASLGCRVMEHLLEGRRVKIDIAVQNPITALPLLGGFDKRNESGCSYPLFLPAVLFRGLPAVPTDRYFARGLYCPRGIVRVARSSLASPELPELRRRPLQSRPLQSR